PSGTSRRRGPRAKRSRRRSRPGSRPHTRETPARGARRRTTIRAAPRRLCRTMPWRQSVDHSSAVRSRRVPKKIVKMKTRHVVLVVLCVMYFVAYVDRVNIAVAAPLMRRDLGLTPVELGVVFSAFAYPYAAMQIAGGWAADRFGPRRVLASL